jgi:hypothetical protein
LFSALDWLIVAAYLLLAFFVGVWMTRTGANAWTEIAGISSAFVASLVLYALFPNTRAEYLLFWIVAFSTVTALTATLATPPESERALSSFVRRVAPFGFWGGRVAEEGAGHDFGQRFRMWLLGLVCTFSGMCGIGHLLKLNGLLGAGLCLVSVVTFALLLRSMSRSRAD